MTGTSVTASGIRPTAFPRAYFVPDVRMESDPEKELAALFDPKTDIRHTAYVEKNVIVFGSGEASIVSYAPNRMTIDTSTDGLSFLVLSDTYYPGWNAYVDGVKTPVYRTNYAFRGVIVPQGEHEVVFRYQPTSFLIGGVISLSSLLAWIVYYWYNRKPKGSVAKW